MGSSLTEAHLGELKQIFELFDGDADGLLDVAEVGVVQLVGDTLTGGGARHGDQVAPGNKLRSPSSSAYVPADGRQEALRARSANLQGVRGGGRSADHGAEPARRLAALGQPVSALVNGDDPRGRRRPRRQRRHRRRHDLLAVTAARLAERRYVKLGR